MTTRPWPVSSSSDSGGSGAALTLFSYESSAEAQGAVSPGPTRRIKLVVAYDGRGYHGFALQPGVETVGGALVAALERHLRHTVDITCAGRTDSGVHAWGQVVTFDARVDAEPAVLQRSLNRALRPRIVVREAAVVPEEFDARRSATGRLYRYSIRNEPVANPFTAGTAWHVPQPLDLPAMRLAGDALIGQHDFSSFCRRPPLPRPVTGRSGTGRSGTGRPGTQPAPDASAVRVVRDARWSVVGDDPACRLLRFEIEASAFCHQMVRSVVGTLVEVGLGKRRAGDMLSVLAARSRAAAGQPAPPHGLCLWEVSYPPAGTWAGGAGYLTGSTW